MSDSPTRQYLNVFTYVIRDEFGRERTEHGSYFSRARVGTPTLRRFVLKAMRQHIPASTLLKLERNDE